MKNEKARAFGEAQSLQKILDDRNFNLTKFSRQLCSFCFRTLGNDSRRFNGIGACRKCFRLSHELVYALHNQRREYSKRFERGGDV
jgi:hypothetical protein